MWIFLNNAMLSIVSLPERVDPTRRCLLVRARFRPDIGATFPGVSVQETNARDYRFRAVIGRDEVAQTIARQIGAISYENFKGSVRDKDRHDDYLMVWAVMEKAQRREARRENWPNETVEIELVDPSCADCGGALVMWEDEVCDACFEKRRRRAEAGGRARAEKLSKERRVEIARNAAKARWSGPIV